MQASAVQHRPACRSTKIWHNASTRNAPRARTSIQAHASLEGSLSLLTRRIEQLKASERQQQWPGYSQWRTNESSETSSPWRGYGEWRTSDQQTEQRMQSSLRHRLSKPPLAHGDDLAAEQDNFDRSRTLEEWHSSCWKQFGDSTSFDKADEDTLGT